MDDTKDDIRRSFSNAILRTSWVALPCFLLGACADDASVHAQTIGQSQLTTLDGGHEPSTTTAGVERAIPSKEQEAIYYDDSAAPLRVAVKFCRNNEAMSHPNVECYMGWDYAVVGGGAYAAFDGAGALLTGSFPVDRYKWQASSSDTSAADAVAALDPHFLYTYAVGIRLDGISVQALRQMISDREKTSPGTSAQPEMEFDVGPGMISGGALSSDPRLYLTRSLAGKANQWRATAKGLLAGSAGQVTAKATSLGAPRVIEGFGALEIVHRSGQHKRGTGSLTVQDRVTSGYGLLGYGADSDWENGSGRFLAEVGMGFTDGDYDPRTVRASSTDHGSASTGGLTVTWSEARKRPGSHGLCNPGGPLASDMDSCVATVCGRHPSCCNRSWDATCVAAVTSECGRSCADYTCSLPGYHPSVWNDGPTGTVQPNNNCYNYANNRIQNGYAHPGRSSGQACSAPGCNTVSTVTNLAMRDGLLPTSATAACPDNRDKIALVIAPQVDYHWYRQGTDGMWSHKPGNLEATNLDNSGKPIANPETADRADYTEFGGYFCTCSSSIEGQGHATIN